VAWMEFAAQRSSFRLRRLERSGGRSAAMEVTPSRVTGYPRMVRSGKELLLAWTESGDDDQNPEQIKGARVKLP
jgi:hypothetical protein